MHPLKKNEFVWTKATNQSFLGLKEAMCTTPALAVYDFKNNFVLDCDALATIQEHYSCKKGIPWPSLVNNCVFRIWINALMRNR